METKKNIFVEHLAAWLELAGNKKGRGELAREIARVAKVHMKSVPRSFRRVQLRGKNNHERRGRKVVYGPDANAALKEVAEAASWSCGENLHSQISEYVRIFKRDGMWGYDEVTTKYLLAMSVATVKRRVEKFAHLRKMVRGKSTTKQGSIKSLIPIRSGPWDEALAGTVQIDTVAHCGDSIAGDFIYTLNATDVPTLWGERRAQWNKTQEGTIRSLTYIDAHVPFPVIEWHPDTGSEFVNWLCYQWVKARGQDMTRSRPNRKNDNCFVEERNGHVVRKWVGYSRLEQVALVDALNSLYDVLTPYLNHFIASRRIVSRTRVGAKWKIAREKKARTPYERVMARDDVSGAVKTKLRTEHERFNPLILKREIQKRLAMLYDIRKRLAEPK